MCITTKITTSIQLYKYLLRSVKLLPPEAQGYYKTYVRQVSIATVALRLGDSRVLTF